MVIYLGYNKTVISISEEVYSLGLLTALSWIKLCIRESNVQDHCLIYLRSPPVIASNTWYILFQTFNMLLSCFPCLLALCIPIATSYAFAIRRNPDSALPENSPPGGFGGGDSGGRGPSSACSKSLPRGVAVGRPNNVTIHSNGIERSYLINIPKSYQSQSSSPLVLSYHGGNRNAISQLELDLFTLPEFNTMNAILVYPQGINVRLQSSIEAT